MRISDYIEQARGNLWKKKLRTFGLALAAAVSFVINEVINALMAREHAPRMSYFDFPWWLCLGAILFSILISLLAGIYPTRRAARVNPVVALRQDWPGQQESTRAEAQGRGEEGNRR